MLNFNYNIPTKVFFGKEQIIMLGDHLKIKQIKHAIK